MVDKIYSRARIKFPKIKFRKKNKFCILVLIILGIIIASIISFIIMSYPIFVASCKTAASSKAVNIVSDEVENVMEGYTYNDLIDIEKDESGKITLMKANTVLINELTAKISSNIQGRIDNSPTTMVYINYGSVSGISILKNFGPKFEIELESAGKIDTKVQSEFQSVNINQTIHKIYLELTTSVSILTPLGSFGKDVESKVLLTEAVIVGDVPENYYNLEGVTKDDTLNMLE